MLNEIKSSLRQVRTYFGYRCRKNNDFVELSYPLHELVDTWSLDNVHVVEIALNFNRDGEIGLV